MLHKYGMVIESPIIRVFEAIGLWLRIVLIDVLIDVALCGFLWAHRLGSSSIMAYGFCPFFRFCLSMVTTSLYDLVPGIIACSSKELSFKEIISDCCLVIFFDSERVDLLFEEVD